MGLGAAVTIAEFDEDSGTSAARRLQAEKRASQVLALIGSWQAEVEQLQAELVAGGSGPQPRRRSPDRILPELHHM